MNSQILLYVKLFLGTILSIFLIFFTWKLTYAYHCLSLFFPLVMLLVISYGYIEFKKEERKCISISIYTEGKVNEKDVRYGTYKIVKNGILIEWEGKAGKNGLFTLTKSGLLEFRTNKQNDPDGFIQGKSFFYQKISEKKKTTHSNIENTQENRSGVIRKSETEYSDEYAESVLRKLLPATVLNKLISPSTRKTKAKSILSDCGNKGKNLSFQEVWISGARKRTIFKLLIAREQNIKLRHKLVLDTNMADWKTIKEESTLPAKNLFKSTYLLVQSQGKNGRMCGLAFYKGSMVSINVIGTVNDSTIKNLKEATWEMAKNLEAIYDSKIKKISEGTFFGS